MKKFYLVFSCLLLSFMGMGQQLLSEELLVHTEADPINPCIEVDLQILENGSPASVVNMACPENFEYCITINNKCNPGGTLFNPFICSYDFTLIFNDTQVGKITGISNAGINSFKGNISNLPGAENLGYPFFHKFQIIIDQVCIDVRSENLREFVTTKTYCKQFQAVGPGNEFYTTSERTGAFDLGEEFCYVDIADEDFRPICCQPDKTVSYGHYGLLRFDKSTSTTTIVNIGANFSLKGKIGESSASISGGSQFQVSYATSELFRDDYPVSSSGSYMGKDGACVFPKIQYEVEGFKEITFKSICDGPDEEIGSKIVYVPYNLIISGSCCQPAPSGCKFLQVPTFIYRNDKSNSDCNGSITGDYSDLDLSEITIEWTGPDGFTSNEFNLEGLALGIYSFTLQNDCCDEVSGQVELCPDKAEGPWIQQEDVLNYCKNVVCTGTESSTPCSTETEVCVTADETITVYNGTNCVDQHFYFGELLGEVASDGISNQISYNAAANLCTELIYCNDAEVDSNVESPTLGFPRFNFATEKCEKSIFCFNEEMDEIFIEDPIIEEDYNDLSGLCERTAYCDGVPQFLPPTLPMFLGQWTWTEFQGCERDIQCEFGGTTYTDMGSESFNNWSWNESQNICESDVSCDWNAVNGAVNQDQPNGFGPWSDWSNSGIYGLTCSRNVFCGGQTFTDFAQGGIGSIVPNDNSCPVGPNRYIVCNNIETSLTGCFAFKSNELGSVNVYPNPFKDEFSISGLEGKVKTYNFILYNNLGEVVLKEQLKSNTIKTENLANGLYHLILFKKGSEVITQKIIKVN